VRRLGKSASRHIDVMGIVNLLLANIFPWHIGA
jgi:hypothetical protein